MLDEGELRALIAAAGLEHMPLGLALRGADGPSLDWVQGAWPNGRNVIAADRFYGASLAKQVTGAAIAVLEKRGRLDVDAMLGEFLPELPEWRHSVSLRQVLHHLGGLPVAGMLEEAVRSEHWTSAAVMRSLSELRELPFTLDTYHYSNAGYVCLAQVVERIGGMPFATFVQEALFDPLQLSGIAFVGEAAPASEPHLAGLGDVLPLSNGDGGLWTTAAAFADWLDHQNRDTLGLAGLLEQPGRLPDGSATDYGWGIGIRSFGRHPMFIHGGSWPGAQAKAVRCREFGLGIVALAATSEAGGADALVDTILRTIADRLTTRPA